MTRLISKRDKGLDNYHMKGSLKQKYIILFDESGTPSFGEQKDQEFFLGVSVLYDSVDEERIFNDLDSLMRLSNNKTLKNKSIKESRAIKIANRLCSHNLRIEARTLDLENNELKQTGETYEQFGNLSRRIYRNTTKERKISHFLHDEIMFYCITDLISKTFSIKRDCDLQIEPYIDDWSYTSIDKHIALEYFSNKFSIWLNELSVEKQINVNISVKNIALLDDAKDRKKRFIDVLTSVISRAYFDCSDERFTDIPLIMLKNSLKENFNIDNATNDLILFMLKAILDNIQETKQEKKNLIHIPK